MSMKKFISGLLAFSLASAAMTTVYATGEKLRKKYFSPYELTAMVDYMNGKQIKNNPEDLDVNMDGVVNVLDTVKMKECISDDYSYYRHVLSYSDYDRDICSSEKLSQMADVVAKTAGDLLRENEKSEISELTLVTSEDESEFSEMINSVITEKYGYRNLRWMMKCDEFNVIAVLCTVNGEKTGSSYVHIPEDVNIPYDEIFLNGFGSSDFKWENYYRTTTQLNEDAKLMFGYIIMIISNAAEKGTLPEDFSEDYVISSEREDDTPFYKALKKAVTNLCRYNCKWCISFKDGQPAGIIVTDYEGRKTGAFPYAVPQNLDIPYSDSNTDYAFGNKVWEDDFSECISEDAETAVLPDYPEMTAEESELKAVSLYYFLDNWANNGEKYIIEDGTYFSENISELAPAFRANLLTFNYEHFIFTIKDGKADTAEYINDACNIKEFVDKERLQQFLDNNPPKRVTSSNIQVGTSSGNAVPSPDYTLYYSTDENCSNTRLFYKGVKYENLALNEEEIIPDTE